LDEVSALDAIAEVMRQAMDWFTSDQAIVKRADLEVFINHL
jgi:hypothetical protein